MSAIVAGARSMSKGLCAAALCGLLALSVVLVPGAWGSRIHPTAAEKFGPDGTTGTSFEGLGGLAINQSNRHLFAYQPNPGQIAGFAISSPTSRTPLGSPFPVEAPGFASYPTVVASAKGNVYYFSTSPRKIFGIKENGEKIAARFPIFPPVDEGYTCGAAADGKGDLWVEVNEAPWYEPTLIVEYSPAGEEIRSFRLPSEIGGGSLCSIAFNTATEDMYVSQGQTGGEYGTYKLTAASEYERPIRVSLSASRLMTIDATTGVGYFVQSTPTYEQRVVAISPKGAVLEEFALGEEITGLAFDESDGTVYVGRNSGIEVFPAGAILPDATTEGVQSATTTSATVTGFADPAGGSPITGCRFEYGETTGYTGGTVPCGQALPLTSAQTVSATLPGLKPGRKYHYRLVLENGSGVAKGADRVATVSARPTIDGLFSSNLTGGSAQVSARINPQGSPTTYSFEYGSTAQYGSVVPLTPGSVGTSQADQRVDALLTGLSPHTYHFRVIAENEFGRVVSPDQTFSYYPPECPNAHLRQQTGGSYLPDCRAYELVSPGNAGGAVMFPETAPAAPYATNPARFAFGAGLGVIPGTQPTNGVGIDTFIATRTDTGWVTRLGGLRGYETLTSSLVWGNKSFSKILDFREPEDFGGVPQPPQYMPFLWDAENNFLERWPANFESIPNSEESRGAFQPSADFSHLAFSSNNVSFTKGGLEEAPGSAYDYDVANHTLTLISVLPNGEPIGQDPGSNEPNEFIFFPGNRIQTKGFSPPVPNRGAPALGQMSGVSEDGSHILMATTKSGYTFGEKPDTRNLILYMRVNDAITYLVSRGKAVNYVGMTANGGKVYFTSTEQLTSEDQDHSLDLYLWTEATDSLKLVSQGSGGTGQGENCSESAWAPSCGIEVVEGQEKTDNSIAAASGDVYFYSPELLAGEDHGIPGRRNLYVFRGGSVEYVTTFEEGEKQLATRFQVSPDGTHMALLTRSQLNSYENGGFAEMYSFEPETEKLVCVSCLPDGEEPSSPVDASLDGLFMSNDGRTFFYTGDALVPRDTDRIHDVYEYTEGQAQLISSGTGSKDRTLKANSRPGGFVGVSADGVNAYFVTYENLVPQDENGQFLKYYDARVGGGFPFVKPSAQCEAADECHGEGSTPPTLAQIVSESPLGAGGNAEPPVKKKPAKKHKKAKKKHKKAKRGAGAGRHARTGGGKR